ncbi:ComEC/Rec2 family competence protein [Candidatus Nomurabacteria bacterium]|nr:ComEC/Rec2 family competence protein [Candidatus Nomurabacteria bacterium]USN94746.1 MAG: ComEC/Rec2 family competence protein [Candidatus Nomurabacteria bacterium]
MKDRYFYPISFGFIFGVFWAPIFLKIDWFDKGFLYFVFSSFLFFVILKTFSFKNLSIGIFIIAFCSGGGYFLYRDGIKSEDLSFYVGKDFYVEGEVSSYPEETTRKKKFILKSSEYRTKFLVYVEKDQELDYKNEVFIGGQIALPENFFNDFGREFDYISYLKKDGINYIIYADEVQILENEKVSLVGFLYKIRQKVTYNMERFVKSPEKGLLSGIMIGEKGGIPDDLEKDFILVGLIHIVALSGYNVSIVALGVEKFFNLIFSKRFALSLAMISIVLFVLMTGSSQTSIRAGIMAILALLALSSGFEYSITRGIFWAAFLMLVIKPNLLSSDISFQLSFLATLGVVYISPLIQKVLKRKKLGFFLTILTTTLAAQIAVSPFILYKMGTFSVVSLPINLLVLPVIPFIMIFGGILAFLGFLPVLAEPIAFLGEKLLSYIIFLTKYFADLSFATLYIEKIPVFLLVFYYIAIIFWILRNSTSLEVVLRDLRKKENQEHL